jgi:hypothetical protein
MIATTATNLPMKKLPWLQAIRRRKKPVQVAIEIGLEKQTDKLYRVLEVKELKWVI